MTANTQNSDTVIIDGVQVKTISLEQKRLVIVRGHSGSGKSTFSSTYLFALTDAFKRNNPPLADQLKTIKLENDEFLYKKGKKGDTIYDWSFDNVDRAQAQLDKAFNYCINENYNLIILSNVFAVQNSVQKFIDIAKTNGYEIEIYRTQNWYPNIHNVPQNRVTNMFLQIESNRLDNQIDVPVIFGNKEMQRLAQDIAKARKNFDNQNLSYDDVHNTYITKDYLLANNIIGGYLIKRSERYPNLSILKYKNNVFYNNSWDNALLEMRGAVIDENYNIIIRPFDKLFNYSERIAPNAFQPLDIKDDEMVNVVWKVNGFLGVATYVTKMNEVIYSTTGSLDSSFRDLVEKHLKQYENLFKAYPDHSFMFEICDESDIHIIREVFGEYLIGCRNVSDGKQLTEEQLDIIAKEYTIKRPYHKTITFGELKDELKTCQHEGYMVYSLDGTKRFKMKSPHYLISKFLGRGKNENLEVKLSNKELLDEEYFPLVDYVNANIDEFKALDELGKIAFIQDFLKRM